MDTYSSLLHKAQARAERLAAVVDDLMQFDISSVFDVKGTYTERKAREWRELKDNARAAPAQHDAGDGGQEG